MHSKQAQDQAKLARVIHGPEELQRVEIYLKLYMYTIFVLREQGLHGDKGLALVAKDDLPVSLCACISPSSVSMPICSEESMHAGAAN
ncbi:hypothetical protein DAI22_08g231300 [Oryza sativa Japonica Group]|nr:hypothetical protein DAI22_08g231300 [Oryza sativa Japonica Group]